MVGQAAVKPSNFSTAGPVSVARFLAVMGSRPINSVEALNELFGAEWGKVRPGHTANVVRFLRRCGALKDSPQLELLPELVGAASGETLTEEGKYWFIRALYPRTPPFADVMDRLFGENLEWESLLEGVYKLHGLNKWGRQQLAHWCRALSVSVALLGKACVNPWIDSRSRQVLSLEDLRTFLTSLQEVYGGPNNQIQLSNFERDLRTRFYAGASSPRLVAATVKALSDRGALSVSRGKQDHVFVTIGLLGDSERKASLDSFLS